MSRSYRKTPCVALTSATSDKPFKEESSRKLRHNVKQEVKELVKNPELADDVVIVEKGRELTDPYTSPKDGKTWIGNRKEWRDSKWYEKALRK